jgi:divalent metal cation (Fe/Co/Zn/Cd) transporter
MRKNSGERTLLASVVLSAPGPLVVGAGLFIGRSFTQLADLIRRTAELAAIIVAWAIFRALHKDGEPDPARKARLERAANRCVGLAMCVSGAVMALLALSSQGAQGGNVIPGLVIASLGVLTNCWFWLRYQKLNRAKPDAILRVQSRLYLAKFLVDVCVTAALTAIAIAPASSAARFIDLASSMVVCVYLIVTGVKTAFGA